MVIFYKKWKKYNEIQLTKNKMDLNIRKITDHPPSSELAYIGTGLPGTGLPGTGLWIFSGNRKNPRIDARS